MAEPLRNPPADWETETTSPGADPFRYGWRIRHVRLPSGEVTEQQIPLTPADLLDPQLGDVVVQSVDHYWEAHDVAGPLRDHFASREDVLVTSDVKMLWGIPDLAEPAPDVAVIFGIRGLTCKAGLDLPEIVVTSLEEIADREVEKVVDEGTGRWGEFLLPGGLLSGDAPLKAIQAFLGNTFPEIYPGKAPQEERERRLFRSARQ